MLDIRLSPEACLDNMVGSYRLDYAWNRKCSLESRRLLCCWIESYPGHFLVSVLLGRHPYILLTLSRYAVKLYTGSSFVVVMMTCVFGHHFTDVNCVLQGASGNAY